MPATARTLLNWVNLSTPLGLFVARLGGARVRRGPRGLRYAEGYRLGFPVAAAFTVGSVIVTKDPTIDALEDRWPGTLAHEERHSDQWAYCLGLPFLPAYAVTMGWSWLRTGNRGAGCFFEREAGLAEGGYPVLPTRPLRAGLAAALRLAGGSSAPAADPR